MARKPETSNDVLATAPVMPAASVDFNALNDAIAAGKTADEAIAAATPPAVEAQTRKAGVTYADATAERADAPTEPAAVSDGEAA